MFPFWEMVVAPVVKATGARRVVEIGALRGETTAQMFDSLPPESELHVIDPLPQFDPAEHEAQFPGRYVFHRALSLEVLPDLPAVDVALIDGDHNWYTVHEELELLDAAARRDGRELPLLVLHDVGWPYGRRDLYYEPSQIPEEFRQPWRRAGLVWGFKKLFDDGGMNMSLANAVEDGGPRNGVLTALEDFLADHDEPVRKVILPFYFGLAIVAEERRLAANPELARLLDELESAEGRRRLLQLSERIRLEQTVREHNWNRMYEARIAAHRDRYLELLAAALHDEHYLENEIRLEYLLGLPPGAAPEPASLRDPARTLHVRFDRLTEARRAGRSADVPRGYASYPYADASRPALDHLRAEVARLAADGPAGDLAACGVGRGGAGIWLRGLLEAWEDPDRTLWMVDPFLASAPVDGEADPNDATSRAAQRRADLHQVRDGFERFGLLDQRTRFVQGALDVSLRDAPVGPLALLHVGVGAVDRLEAVLRHLLPKVVPGGAVVVEGVGTPRVDKALATVRDRLGIADQLERVDWDTVAWRVGEPIAAPADAEAEVATTPHRVLVPEGAATDRCSLSVVVVFYDMRREAARTLRSLSRSYQRGVDDLDYEVIVVDNGSSPDHRLSDEEVAAYGPEFRLVQMGDGATSSPTVALNAGIAASRGEAVALMIDGAHVLTPGVFAQALAAMRTYEPAVVAIQQWYVGPGQQGDAQQAGYDQAVEDTLFQRIKWPTDGYRLFEIGHFIGDRDWFDGIIESNCLFAPRWLLEQVGGFDDSFDMAGGGYANLELFERLHSHPGVHAASVLGEGTFHQFHGGTTTNVADEAVRRERVFSYGEHFRETKGRPLQGLNKPVHFVGSMQTKAARRTRSRRAIELAFDPARDPVESTPTEVLPVPEEVKFAAIDALWHNQGWREASWLGHPVNRYPTDLHAYQELLTDVRPDTVVLLGEDGGLGGRALFAATVLDQLGAGRVVAVGTPAAGERPAHGRVTYVDGPPDAPEAVERVRQLVGDGSALVLIGLGPVLRVLGAFGAYAPLVPEGGYVVVENTVLNGRPAASEFGPGPHEAVNQILQTHRDFVPDVAYERYTVTFNKNGYLRRTAAP